MFVYSVSLIPTGSDQSSYNICFLRGPLSVSELFPYLFPQLAFLLLEHFGFNLSNNRLFPLTPPLPPVSVWASSSAPPPPCAPLPSFLHVVFHLFFFLLASPHISHSISTHNHSLSHSLKLPSLLPPSLSQPPAEPPLQLSCCYTLKTPFIRWGNNAWHRPMLCTRTH